MKGEWRLLFRASRNGFAALKFHSKCDNKYPGPRGFSSFFFAKEINSKPRSGDNESRIKATRRERKTSGYLACVAWRFWLGARSNKGGRGQRNREEIGAEATWFLFFSRLRRSCARFNKTAMLRRLCINKFYGCIDLLKGHFPKRSSHQVLFSLQRFDKPFSNVKCCI